MIFSGSDTIGTFSLLALLLSIFNIINLVASNVNNNNNRNNINDNSGNLNTADNTESNANSGSMTATQVMMVPPGVGRRKRNAESSVENPILTFNATNLILSHRHELIFEKKIQSLNEEFIEEIPLGTVVTLNAWHLSTFSKCQNRNFCEMGLNCATFGPGAEFSCEFGAQIISRWISEDFDQEKNLIKAFHEGRKLSDCHLLYQESCPVHEWNEFIKNSKNEINYS